MLDTLCGAITTEDSRYILTAYPSVAGTIWLRIECEDRISEVTSGPFFNPFITLCCDGKSITFKFCVYFQPVFSGTVDTGCFLSLLKQLPDSGYEICPGITSYPPDVRFKTKHLHDWGEPFNRLDSDTCELWLIPNNSRQLPTNVLYNACKACKQLHHDIQQLVKRSATTSDAQKQARTLPSSNYGLKYLSPASQKCRVSRIIQEKKCLNVKVQSLEPFNCDLSDKQHAEMLMLVKELNKNSKAIRELCDDGDKILGTDNNLLRAAWQQDVTERLEYEKDQCSSGTKYYCAVAQF